MIVVKVGGSLFDHPGLGPGLRAFVRELAPADVLLVPGGGPVADAVRALDRTHGLGEEAAHWLALRSLAVTKALLEALMGEPNPPAPFPRPGAAEIADASEARHPGRTEKGVNLGIASSNLSDAREVKPTLTPLPFREGGPGGLSLSVLDPFAFAQADEGRPGALPHAWSVTTDSVAARAAAVLAADRLILLKSTDVPAGTPWAEAAARGWVDAHFPQVARTLACPIEAINFRRRLSPPA